MRPIWALFPLLFLGIIGVSESMAQESSCSFENDVPLSQEYFANDPAIVEFLKLYPESEYLTDNAWDEPLPAETYAKYAFRDLQLVFQILEYNPENTQECYFINGYKLLNQYTPNRNELNFQKDPNKTIELLESIKPLTRSGPLNMPSSDESSAFIDFPYANRIGEPIKFILEKTGYTSCNSYRAEITDKNGTLVWSEGKFALCDPIDNQKLITSQIKIGYVEDNPIIINKSGKYYLEVEYDNSFTKREFVVRQNHTGMSLDKTVYPVMETLSPLKQIKMGIYGNDIQCRDERVLVLKKSSELYSCIMPETVPKLFARNWALNEVKIIDPDTAEQGSKLIKITGVVDRLFTTEGFEYHLIPLREELPRIEYTGYDTLNLFSTKDTAHNFLRNIEGTLVKVEGRFLLDDGEYFRHFSGFPTITVQKLEKISEFENLEYSIEGAEILSIVKIPDVMMLNIVLQEAQNGVLEIAIPREVMDTRIGMTDDDFFVLVDGIEVDFLENKNSVERTLTIEFEKDARTIQVIGSFPL